LLLNKLLHNVLEGFEVDPFVQNFFLVIVVANHSLLQSCNVVFVQSLPKHFLLQVLEVAVIQVSVVVLVTNSKNSR